MSMKYGVVPKELKLAKVTPIFKAGDTQLCTNYRPISVLCVLSKIFERLVYNQLMGYVNDRKILYKLQFGFRKNHLVNLP